MKNSNNKNDLKYRKYQFCIILSLKTISRRSYRLDSPPNFYDTGWLLLDIVIRERIIQN
ncbi:hypothetical protein U3516DRAFT_733947 [Neocallimastix sp. 'constans']